MRYVFTCTCFVLIAVLFILYATNPEAQKRYPCDLRLDLCQRQVKR